MAIHGAANEPAELTEICIELIHGAHLRIVGDDCCVDLRRRISMRRRR